MAKKKSWNFYAVARGRKPGIYTDWSDCFSQVNGFKGNDYKGFDTRAEAEAFIKENGTEPKHEKVNFKCSKKKTLEPRKSIKVESADNVARSEISVNGVQTVQTKIEAAKKTDSQIDRPKPKFRKIRFISAGFKSNKPPTPFSENAEDIKESLREFANWEKYTKGIGSKLLAKMGFVFGGGLGKHLEGRPTIIDADFRDAFDDDFDDENEEKFKDYVNVHIDALLENKLNVGDSANFRIYWGKDHDYNLTKAKKEASEDDDNGDDNDERAPRLSKLGKELVLLTETIRLAHDQEITELRVHTFSIPLIHNIRYNIPYWKSEKNKVKWTYEIEYTRKDALRTYVDEFGDNQSYEEIVTKRKSIPFAMIKVIEDLDEALDESGITLALKLKRPKEMEKRKESTD